MYAKWVCFLQSNLKIALLLIVSLSALSLLAFRIYSYNWNFVFLVWNLFLAWIPLLFIKMVWTYEQKHKLPLWLLAGYFLIWLLFFPNAPYIITDFKHLRGVPENMIWYDALMIFNFSIAGFLAGLYSIRIVHRIFAHRWNHAVAWLMVMISMLLSGFGIYLGRYGRWNSWDFVTQPKALLKGISSSITDPFAIKHTFTFSFVMMLLYFAFHIFAELKKHEGTHKYS
jgi:uncharacterized membrane protein